MTNSIECTEALHNLLVAGEVITRKPLTKCWFCGVALK